MNNIKHTITILWLCLTGAATAQRTGIGTNSPDASAILEISGTNGGLLIPRMTSAQRDAIAAPASGLMVYVTDQGDFWCFNGSS
ncbi:MAG TPA: hypothetical protein PLV75_07400, partial [Saprospiraceae bacterium]|nr:hypothetical protein [Saprospiraceae bacterium]